MNKKIISLAISSTVLSMLPISFSVASGFQLQEQSVTGIGRATAGTALSGDDLSAAFYNPAEMFFINTDKKYQAGVLYVHAQGTFKSDSVTKTLLSSAGSQTIGSEGKGSSKFREASVIPHTYFVTDIADNLKFGLSIAVPFGLSTEYSKGWAGRYHALESSVKVIDFNPSIAYQVNDKFNIGFGVSAQRIEAVLSQAVFTGTANDGYAKVKGNDLSFGYNFGLAYAMDEDTRFSFSYRSKVSHELDGERTLRGVGARSGKVDATAKITLPDTATLSAFRRINDQLEIMSSLRWTNWSEFKELRVSFDDGSADSVTDESWEDSWAFALGANYHYSEKLTLRAGVAFDQAPIPDAEHRTPRIPDGDRVWLSAGFTYKPAKNINLDFGYTHIFIDEGDVNNTVGIAATANGVVTETLIGKTSGSADIVGVQATFDF